MRFAHSNHLIDYLSQSKFNQIAVNGLAWKGVGEATVSTAFNYEVGIDLDASFGEKLLIGSGRAFVKTGQGIKQLGLIVGEKLGIVSDGETASYTSSINKQTALYHSTPVGQSAVAKTGEVITDAAVAVMVPGGSGASGAKLIASSAGTGAFLGGIHPTEDGSLTSRAQNMAIGGAGGAVGGYVFTSVRPNSINHC
jgi:hypothetical protein